jgi:hypothetical protein
MLALSRLKEHILAPTDELDFQQPYIEEQLGKERGRILSSESPTKEITEVAYEIIHRMLHNLIEETKSEFHCKKIILIGGISINTSPDQYDYFDMRNFEIIEPECEQKHS